MSGFGAREFPDFHINDQLELVLEDDGGKILELSKVSGLWKESHKEYGLYAESFRCACAQPY